MQRLKIISIVIISSVLFTWVFYQQRIGLNLLIFESFILTSTIFLKRSKLSGPLEIITFSGTIITAVLVLIHNSALSIAVNIISIILFSGTILFPQLRNLIYAFFLSFLNFFKSQNDFIKLLLEGNNNAKSIVKYFKIIGFPIVIFIFFLIMYKLSNPILEKYTDSAFQQIDKWLTSFFTNINVPLVLLFILGLMLSIHFFLGKAGKKITMFDNNGNDFLIRKRVKHLLGFKTMALQNEYKTGVFLFAILNLLLLVVNIIDVYWVWFNFEWNGQYLKQFVHEGTYLLIFSVLLSIGLTLYYFRGNQNFLKNNKWLVRLSSVWLVQNAILIVSVAIRNYWYIYYFALAYKRIGVIFFLIATLIAIYLVFQKIKHKKSAYFLVRKNILSIYVILVAMALFNWDVIIAKYNFKHYERSFVHLNFLSSLSNNALPYLDLSANQLELIHQYQRTHFEFKIKYMNPEEYLNVIDLRKTRFINDFRQRSLLSWNLADQRANDILIKKGETE
jgi:hypothetical protein